MALPTIIVGDGSCRQRVIILLSGFDEKAPNNNATGRPVTVFAKDELLKTVKRDRDAVAFGFVGGKWIPAA